MNMNIFLKFKILKSNFLEIDIEFIAITKITIIEPEYIISCMAPMKYRPSSIYIRAVAKKTVNIAIADLIGSFWKIIYMLAIIAIKDKK